MELPKLSVHTDMTRVLAPQTSCERESDTRWQASHQRSTATIALCAISSTILLPTQAPLLMRSRILPIRMPILALLVLLTPCDVDEYRLPIRRQKLRQVVMEGEGCTTPTPRLQGRCTSPTTGKTMHRKATVGGGFLGFRLFGSGRRLWAWGLSLGILGSHRSHPAGILEWDQDEDAELSDEFLLPRGRPISAKLRPSMCRRAWPTSLSMRVSCPGLNSCMRLPSRWYQKLTSEWFG